MSDYTSTVLVIEHAPPERTYALGEVLRSHGHCLDVRRVFNGDALPSDLSSFSGLVVMGGPMSADSDNGFPTRRREIQLLRQAIEKETPTLGICLGAQLLALAGGGSIAHPGQAEIGWARVTLSPARTSDLLFKSLPREITAFHWHDDAIRLPVGALHLGSTDITATQAFRIGELAWGLQFHAEVTHEAATAFANAFPADAARGGGRKRLLEMSSSHLQGVVSYQHQMFNAYADAIRGVRVSPLQLV